MTEKHVKKCSVSLAFREMQMKISLRSHPIHVRMSGIKNKSDSSCWRVGGTRGRLLHSSGAEKESENTEKNGEHFWEHVET